MPRALVQVARGKLWNGQRLSLEFHANLTYRFLKVSLQDGDETADATDIQIACARTSGHAGRTCMLALTARGLYRGFQGTSEGTNNVAQSVAVAVSRKAIDQLCQYRHICMGCDYRDVCRAARASAVGAAARAMPVMSTVPPRAS